MNRSRSVSVVALFLLLTSALLSASAPAAQFAAENTDVPEVHEHALLAGAQSATQIFTAGAGFGGITCTTATLAGTTATGTETKVRLAPTYSGCKDSFGRTVDVTVNSCAYELHPTTGSGATYTGSLDVACEAGKAIEWKITKEAGVVTCTVTVGSQTGASQVHFENQVSEAGTDLKAKFEVTNLKTTTAGGFLNCGVGNGEHKDGTYEGSSTITAEGTAGQAFDALVIP